MTAKIVVDAMRAQPDLGIAIVREFLATIPLKVVVDEIVDQPAPPIRTIEPGDTIAAGETVRVVGPSISLDLGDSKAEWKIDSPADDPADVAAALVAAHPALFDRPAPDEPEETERDRMMRFFAGK